MMGRLCDDGGDGAGEAEASGLTRSLIISSLAVSILFISICLSAVTFSLSVYAVSASSVSIFLSHLLSLPHSDTLLFSQYLFYI